MPKLEDSDREKVIQLYLEGNSPKKIGKLTGIAPSSVSYCVKVAGVSRSRTVAAELRRAIPPDWSFEPLTPSKAWLLGLIFGDGSLHKNRYQVSIVSGDYDVIGNINKIFNSSLKVLNIRDKQCKKLILGSPQIWAELHSTFGLTPNKHATMLYPSIQSDLQAHFVRGLVDSDGSFYSTNKKLCWNYTTCSISFIDSLRSVLVTNTAVKNTLKINVKTNKTSPAFSISCACHPAAAVGDWIYRDSDATNRCQRKYEIWLDGSSSIRNKDAYWSARWESAWAIYEKTKSYREVAETLGVSYPTARKYVFKYTEKV